MIKSAFGTTRTNRAGLTKSVVRGKPGGLADRQTDAFDPQRKSFHLGSVGG